MVLYKDYSVSQNMSMLLEGWKQISYHLRVSQSTAQKWEFRQRMPVHHLPGPKGRVFAESAELDAWTRPRLRGRQRRRTAITVRLPEDVLTALRPLIEQRFSTIQEFVSRAVAHYAEQQLRA